MRTGVVALALAATLGSAGTARAETDAAQTSAQRASPRRNAVSIELPSLLGGGVALRYERFVLPPIFSVVVGGAARASGGPDYDVLETGAGFEGRFWLIGRAPFSAQQGRAMVGPYLGVGLDAGLTRVWAGGHGLGTMVRVGGSGSLGVRITFANRLEVTPSLGIGWRTELDAHGRLAPWFRPELARLGCTGGVLF